MREDLPKLVRKYIFDYFLENSRAPVLEEIMKRFALTRAEAGDVLESLEKAHHVVRLPGTQRILMANPISALHTPFRVRVADRRYFAPCAWDSVAFHVMLGRAIEVDSYCHHCAAKVTVSLSDDKVAASDPRDPLVFLSLPAAKWWENIVLTCANNMVFFSSHEHLEEWLGQNPGVSGEALTLDQTLGISEPIYRKKLDLDYARPPKEQLMSLWDSMGLRGEFWKL